MPERVIVYKLNEKGEEVWQYPARLMARGVGYVRLEATFNRDDMDLGFTTFKRGDRFIEYFYTNRWYNIFAVYDRENGELKGWYCNVCRPAVIEGTAVYCEDLALDLWHAPDLLHPLVLDEEEFAALAIPPADRQQARQALNQLIHLAQQNKLPC
ncbi:MAG: DUF402 domain-containing protein [Chloroflexota bacterium]